MSCMNPAARTDDLVVMLPTILWRPWWARLLGWGPSLGPALAFARHNGVWHTFPDWEPIDFAGDFGDRLRARLDDAAKGIK